MRRTVIAILAITVLVSGCADNTKKKGVDIGTSSQKGLEIAELKAVDDQISAGQETFVVLRLKNYHVEPIDIQDISVMNEGQLDVTERGCTPSEIGKATQGIAPEMECRWKVKAPSEEVLGAFSSKKMFLDVRIAYNSSIKNEKPLKLDFQPLSKIDKAEPVSKTYSNGEVEASMAVENPAPFSGKVMEINVQNAGPGTVKGSYNFSYTPEAVFDCPSKKEPVINSKVDFSCRVQDDRPGTRNLFTSMSYKYVKTPTVDIEVVKP